MFIHYPSHAHRHPLYSRRCSPLFFMHSGPNAVACPSRTCSPPNDEGEPSHKEENTTDSSNPTRKRKDETILFQSRSLLVTENESTLSLILDIPGVKPSDLEVEVHDDDVLRVTTKRKKHGSDSSLPVVRNYSLDGQKMDVPNLKAVLSDGVLTVRVPKKEAAPAAIAIPVQDKEASEETSDNSIQFSMDLPGVAVSDVDAQYNLGDGAITVHAKRKRGGFLLSSSVINKRIQVDPKKIEASKLTASLAAGVLTFEVPLRAVPAAKKIVVGESFDDSEELTEIASGEAEAESYNEDEIVVETVDNECDDKEADEQIDAKGETESEEATVSSDKEWEHVVEN